MYACICMYVGVCMYMYVVCMYVCVHAFMCGRYQWKGNISEGVYVITSVTHNCQYSLLFQNYILIYKHGFP